MICPKCQELMRTLDRGGVHIEQCERCRGVFLDGGELEQIVAAERDHYAEPVPIPPVGSPPDQPPPAYQPPAGPPPAHQPAGGAPPPYQPPPGTPAGPPPPAYGGQYNQGHYGQGHYGQRRKRSFLEQLLD